MIKKIFVVYDEEDQEHVDKIKNYASGTGKKYELIDCLALKEKLGKVDDEELKKEGWLREFLHFIQNSRKNVGFEVTDRIVLGVVLPEEKLEIIKKYINYLKEEALIERLIFGEVIGNKIAFEDGEIYINKA